MGESTGRYGFFVQETDRIGDHCAATAPWRAYSLASASDFWDQHHAE
jgi:hypothetical protein